MQGEGTENTTNTQIRIVGEIDFAVKDSLDTLANRTCTSEVLTCTCF